MPHPFEIATGLFGYSNVHVFGENGDVDATEETLWTQGAIYAYLAAEELLKISSGDAVDGAGAKTGALTMTVYGLNGDYEEIEETVTLTGTDVVTTDDKFLRIFKAVVRTAGSGGKNAGLISIKNAAASVTLMTVPIGLNQSKAALFTVPADTEFFLTDIWGAEANGKKAKMRLYVRPLDEVFQIKFQSGINRNHAHHKHTTPMAVLAKSDIEMRAISSGTDASITAGFEGYYKTP